MQHKPRTRGRQPVVNHPADSTLACRPGRSESGNAVWTAPVQPLIRKLATAESALHAAHLLRLGEHDRAMRFMGYVNDAHIERYCGDAGHNERCVLAYFEEGIVRGVAEAVFDARPAWRGGCGLALSVESGHQGRGIGTELMRRAIVLARNRGAAPVRILFLRENRRMRALALKLGMTLAVNGTEIEASLRPQWPNQFTLLAENLGDGHAWWSRWLAAKARPAKRAAHA